MIIQIITNNDHTPNLSIIHEERTVRLHSSRPKAEAEKITAQLNLNASYFVLGGLGLGYLLEHVLEYRTEPLIVFEPKSEIFEIALELRPELSVLLNQKNVLLARSLNELTNLLQQHKVKDLSFMMHRPYLDLFPEEMTKIQEILAAAIRKNEVGDATLVRFGRLWAKNIFRNLHRYFVSQKLNTFVGVAHGQSAIMIGAGPSLEEAIPYLQKYKNHAHLIACDTALPMLEKYFLEPDFVVTVDPQEKNAFYLRYSRLKNHFLIADPGVHDSTFEDYTNDRIVLMDSLFPFYPYFVPYWGECGLLASGGSVSTSAFDLARKLKASSIIMVGQDLSFSQNKTHNKGNILTEFSYTNFNRLITGNTKNAHVSYPAHAQLIKGRINGTQVLADARFVLFRDWFSDEIAQTVVPVIVAGMEGAFLNGAIHCSVEKAFQRLKTPIKKSYPSFHSNIDSSSFQAYLEEMCTILTPIIKQIEFCLFNIKQSYRQKNLQRSLIETTKIQELLEIKNHQEITQIISVSIQSAIQKVLEMPQYISDQEKHDLILEMTDGIMYGIKTLHKHILKTLQRLQHNSH
ncbi:MAG: motility associated factor glycosyltransferase family protein [Brevinema sp.]